MVTFKHGAKNLVAPKKTKNKKTLNYFAKEFKADFKEIQEKEKSLIKLIDNYAQEVYYQHDTNLHGLYAGIIRYYISCILGNPNTKIAEAINESQWSHRGLAWLESVVFI